MGNFASCTGSAGKDGGVSSCTSVIFPGGEIRQVQGAASAAELMFDTPNHFVVSSRSMHVGRRFSPLAAVEELEMGAVYVMFPMKRVNSVVTDGDMGVLLVAAGSAAARRASAGGGARVLPEGGSEVAGDREESQEPRLRLDEMMGASVGELKYRLSICRSKKPLLETIAEENISVR